MKYKQAGFSLIEILLVIGILMGLVALEIRKQMEDSKNVQAEAVGSQLTQLAQAVDKYITLRLSELQNNTTPAGDLTPLGGNFWELNMGALRSTGLYLAAGEVGENQNSPVVTNFGANYRIILKKVYPPAPVDPSICTLPLGLVPLGCTDPVTGEPPPYHAMFQGLIISAGPWTVGNDGTGAIEWNALGRAARYAGAAAGVTQAGQLVGLSGGYTLAATDFSLPTGVTLSNGQMGYVVGSTAGVLNKFMRRDGSQPMLGNLNMGGQLVDNMKDLFLNGAPNHRRNKNISTLAPNWVHLGSYAMGNGDSITKPVCAPGLNGNPGEPKIKLLLQTMNPDKEVVGTEQALIAGGPFQSQECADAAKYYNDPSVVAGPEYDACRANLTAADSKSKSAWWMYAEDQGANWRVTFERVFAYADGTAAAPKRIAGGGIAEVYCYYE